MPLRFHPKPGTVLVCDYSEGFRPPEMVKKRLAVVISPRLRHRDKLCSVVPLSTTPPRVVQPWHHQIVFERALPRPFEGVEKWAKCDMVATVAFHRLELIRLGRDPASGRRRYIQPRISDDDLERVRDAVCRSLGL